MSGCGVWRLSALYIVSSLLSVSTDDEVETGVDW